MALSFFVITACNSSGIQKNYISTERAETIAECRVVQHALGETCIPIKPQRILALDPPFILDPLLALGLKESIVGMACYDWGWMVKGCVAPGLSSDQLKGIEVVGNVYQPSVEKIVLLKPDLILGLDYNIKKLYKQLSDIAPTVAISSEDDNVKLSFKNHFRDIAQLVDRKEIAEKLLVQYQNRIAEVQEQLSDLLKNVEVSVITYGWGKFWASPIYSIWFQILEDIGINIKPIFLNQENFFTNFSIEKINNYDADIMFIINHDRKPASYFLENPLISSLNAVKSGQIYISNGRDIWDVYGLLGVNQLLDKISQYLLKSIQTL